MKNLLSISITLLMAMTSIAQNTNSDLVINNATVGIFQFESEIVNYGTIQQNSNGNRAFIFKNIGKSPIIISKIKASCGCTIPTKPNRPIMPGETAEIGVKYATNRIGSFSKTITITSNANTKNKTLHIKGNVLKTIQ